MIGGVGLFFGNGLCAAVSADNADEVAAAMHAAYGSELLHADVAVSYRQRIVRDTRFAVAETTVHGQVVTESDALPFLVVTDLPTNGTQTVEAGSSRWHRSDPTPFLFPLQRKRVLWDDVHLRHIILDVAAADDVLAGLGLLPVRLLRLRSAPNAAALHHWTTVATHTRAYASLAAFVDAPLSRSAVFGLLVAAFVEAFADRDHIPVAVTSDSAAGQTAVAVALEYIREHAGEDLPIPAVAAAAGVSVRALQRAFASELGQRPLDAIRAERLRRARDDLRHPDADAPRTVRSVAARWGFTNVGRFAAAYAAAYGHVPAEDLRR